MRIALLGSAPSSVRLAPLKNGRYQEWAQGRYEPAATAHGQVEGDWEIWGCSPGAWSVTPRATRWFEVHRWEPGQAWFSPEYCQFLRNFRGPFTPAPPSRNQNHVVYPIDRMEEKFASYFFTSSLALMCALAIDTIEQVREARAALREARLATRCYHMTLPQRPAWSHQERTRQGRLRRRDRHVGRRHVRERGVRLPTSWLPVLPDRSHETWHWCIPASRVRPHAPHAGVRNLGVGSQLHQADGSGARTEPTRAGVPAADAGSADHVTGNPGRDGGLNNFVNTWTSAYGMLPGMIIRQEKGTGLGSGITTFDGRPIQRMVTRQTEVVRAFAEPEVNARSWSAG
jgi:hypothetical protein